MTDRKVLPLLGWIVLCFSASFTAVFVSTTGWYAALSKPSWNPPSWLFGPVWSTLYLLMAIAAWLVWRKGGWKSQSLPLSVFLLQWILNVFWTPLFFGAHLLAGAFVEIVAMWLAIVATISLFARVEKAAAVLMTPYLAWVSFAAALNFSIWRLNA